jgi:hypothetical protein
MEFTSNGNTSCSSLAASESPLFMATTPTSKLAFASSHVDHAQVCGPGSRQFQFLGIVLIEGNRTCFHILAEFPTPTNRLAFASLLYRRTLLLVCGEFPSGYSTLSQSI